MADPLIIKKYSNRRLYDTEQKSYITLEQLSQLIQQGREVRVIDNQTQEDITQETLLQIILSGEKPHNLFSSALLHQIIRLQEKHLQEFVQYLGASLDYFFKLKQNMFYQFNLWNHFWMNSPSEENKSSNVFFDKELKEYEKKIQELEKQVQELRERKP